MLSTTCCMLGVDTHGCMKLSSYSGCCKATVLLRRVPPRLSLAHARQHADALSLALSSTGNFEELQQLKT